MSDFKKYIFNPETLLYDEQVKPSRRKRLILSLMWFVLSVAAALLYFWIYVDVLGHQLPKTVLLQKQNAAWRSKIELINTQMDMCDDVLEDLASRDDDIYRSIFGMNEVVPQLRNSGFGGVNRYAEIDALDHTGLLSNSVRRMDILLKKTYVQSRSYDDVHSLSTRMGDMASCIPAIPPMLPDRSIYRISSSYGWRPDPKTGVRTFHEGVDFAMKPGQPIFATGDGVIEKVKFDFWGYGTNVLIDHGFGYKTRYAHLKGVNVVEGMQVKRGEQIGQSGNSGKSTGPHLHYEVIYMDRHMNPVNYYDLDVPLDEYRTMIITSDANADFYVHPTHRRLR